MCNDRIDELHVENKEKHNKNMNVDFQYCIITASNDSDVLKSCLLSSPDLKNSNISINIQTGARSAAEAYNLGIQATKEEIMIFVHQDVYLPAKWVESLKKSLIELKRVDPNWGVLGLYGKDQSDRGVGHVYSTGLGRILGKKFAGIIEVETLDEMILILRRSSALKFDEDIPGFHLYGTDICLQARQLSMKSYVFPGFAIHNSNGIKFLPMDYWHIYFIIRKKWKKLLPVMTTCMKVTRLSFPALLYVIRMIMKQKKEIGQRVLKPKEVIKKLSEDKIEI